MANSTCLFSSRPVLTRLIPPRLAAVTKPLTQVPATPPPPPVWQSNPFPRQCHCCVAIAVSFPIHFQAFLSLYLCLSVSGFSLFQSPVAVNLKNAQEPIKNTESRVWRLQLERNLTICQERNQLTPDTDLPHTFVMICHGVRVMR